jgi:hypothetical protein
MFSLRHSVEGLLATSICLSTLIIKVAYSSGLFVNVGTATRLHIPDITATIIRSLNLTYLQFPDFLFFVLQYNETSSIHLQLDKYLV